MKRRTIVKNRLVYIPQHKNSVTKTMATSNWKNRIDIQGMSTCKKYQSFFNVKKHDLPGDGIWTHNMEQAI